MWLKACFLQPVHFWFFYLHVCVLMYDANYLNNGNHFFDSSFSVLKQALVYCIAGWLHSTNPSATDACPCCTDLSCEMFLISEHTC